MVERDEPMSGKDKRTNTNRKNGRPIKGDAPRVPYEDLDRLLVFGEVVTCEDGESTTVRYPSYRDLGRRYNVSNSLIAIFSKKHNCMRRRKEAQARVAAKAEQKLVEFRSTALALSKEDELRIIDSYLAGFEKAIAEERVRFDNPSDFNTMVRLKEFIQGGADSRQEIHAALSLEDIQTRHKRMMQEVEATSAKERGEILRTAPAALPEAGQKVAPSPPALPIDPGPQEVSAHLTVTSSGYETEDETVAPVSAPPHPGESPSPSDKNGQQGAPVALTGQTPASEGVSDASTDSEEDA